MSDHPENLAYELGWAALGEAFGDDDGCEAARAMGEAIVDSAEMQAIKAALRTAAHDVVDSYTNWDTTTEVMAQFFKLPAIVIEWVLS